MLKIRYANNNSIISSCIDVALEEPNFPSGLIPTAIRNQDFFLRDVRNINFYVPYRSTSFSSLFRFANMNEATDHKVDLPVHQLTELEQNSYSSRYSSFLENIKIFAGVLGLPHSSVEIPTREKPCRHRNLTGLLSTTSPTRFEVEGYSHRGYSVKSFNQTITDTYIRSRFPTTYEYTIATLPRRFNLFDYVNQINGDVVEAVNWFGYPLFRIMSNPSVEMTPTMYIISYSMRYFLIGADTIGSWIGKLYIPFDENTNLSVDPLTDVLYHVRLCGYAYWGYENASFSGSESYTGPHEFTSTPSDFTHFRLSELPLTEPSSSSLETTSAAITLSSRLKGALASFSEAVEKDWNNIIPSSLFSSVDAIKDCEGSLDTNILQNLQKLPQIVEILPNLKEALIRLGKLKGNIDIFSVPELLSIISSLDLQVVFTIRPYLDVITKYLPELLAFVNSDTRQKVTGRGSFSYQFPSGTFGRPTCNLVVRTKIVMDGSLTGLLSTILGFDAVGILPKPSNLWDLVPLSFLLNWFTGVSGYFKRFEYSALLAGIPAYYVHTYTLTSEFTEDELLAWKTSNLSTDRASLRLFYRDVSSYSPIPMNSRFSFGSPQGLPPLGTLASLLYQMIF